jgi:prefoldin subunit 5
MNRKLDDVIARIQVIESQIHAARERDEEIASMVREIKATQSAQSADATS